MRQVPKCFLLFTSIYIVLQAIGILLIFETNQQAPETNEATINAVSVDKSASTSEETTEEIINSDVEKLTEKVAQSTELNSLGVA